MEEEPPGQGPGLRSRAQPLDGGNREPLRAFHLGGQVQGALFVEAHSRGRGGRRGTSHAQDTKPVFPPLLL